MAQVLVDCDVDDDDDADVDEDIDVWAVPAHVRAYGRAHRQLAAWSAGVDHLLVKAAAPKPGEHVVDLGSGTGLPALTLASLVGPGRVVAVDRCPEMLAFATQEAERLGI